MKIGYLFSRYPVPSQTFCDTEMRALEECGCEIEVFACSPPLSSFRHAAAGRPRGPVTYAPGRPGLELARLAAEARGVWPAALIAEHAARFGPRYEPARRALHAVALAEPMRRRGIEHVHVHFANRATHAAIFLQALTGIPFSFTAHAQDFLVDLGSDALLAEMCAQAAFVVTVSEFSRRALLEKCPAAEAKVHRIYNGLSLDRWPAPAAPSGTAPDAPLRILSIGRLIDFKGFDDLIAACALLRDRGVAFLCEIAGDGPAEAALRQQITGLHLDSHVQLRGLLPQAEIQMRLAACDVFALAARPDAQGACDVLPTVILEAMAAGRPVVSTRLAAIPEMVIAGETGLLVAPGDRSALADALASLAADAGRRDRLGFAGRARLEAEFTTEISTRQLAPLFVATALPAGACPAPPPSRLLLLDVWPGSPVETSDLTADTRILALQPGPFPASLDETTLSLVAAVEFLPDALALEADWREYPSEAHRLERLRIVLGASVDTDEFLLAARRALYLHKSFPPTPLRQLHATGPRALLCAWLLVALDLSPVVSFALPEQRLLSKTVMQRIAPGGSPFQAVTLPAPT